MSFAKEYEFLTAIGIEPRNSGSFDGGAWKGSGSVVSSVNPANNKAETSFEKAELAGFVSSTCFEKAEKGLEGLKAESCIREGGG
ncbi:hypothetical protein L1987_31486 [Smallanthus sonchifolius]|uniref:Uncharacterized protein n=1 Tax=Smallanthus sonchifolius TaxID=185202 RepID=A0ACB9I794_9ASTR|nr:hypothetical protein L1987_31486 [Smallanthus sonchifolius]